MKTTRNELLTFKVEKTANPNTKEAASARQAKIERDTEEYLANGGKVKQIDGYQAVYPWQK